MAKLATVVRRALGAAPETPQARAEPGTIDVRALYIEAAQRVHEALRFNNQLALGAGVSALQKVAALAESAGLDDALARIWVQPPPAGPGMATWYAAALDHALHGAPDPGPRPVLAHEWAAFRERYRSAILRAAHAYRVGDPRVNAVVDVLHSLRREAIGAGHALLVEKHFMGAKEAGATADEWQAEALYMLEHGHASGSYNPPPPPPPFVRAADLERAQHSAVVLLAPHGDMPLGTLVRLDAATSHALCEAGHAQWCDPATIPRDPRPPVEQEPGEDWQVLHFLNPTRLASRHEVTPGTVRPVEPVEAAELVARGLAEPWTPPPVPPLPLRIVFGDVPAA